jgi:hypothetical protein
MHKARMNAVWVIKGWEEIRTRTVSVCCTKNLRLEFVWRVVGAEWKGWEVVEGRDLCLNTEQSQVVIAE